MTASSRSSLASLRLPAIRHPLSRLKDADNLSLRGYSTEYSDNKPDAGWRSATSSREEVAEVCRPRLPSFGDSLASSRVSPCDSVLQDQVDQLESSLKEQLRRSGALALNTMFKNNNPDGKPLASRSVMLVILSKFLRRLVTTKQLKLLLHRLQLSDKPQISFDDLRSALKDSGPSGPLGLHHVLHLLKGMSRTGFLECLKSVDGKELASPSWITASQLRNVLEKLRLHLPQREFEQLWKRFDADGVGAVKLSVLLEKLKLNKKTTVHAEDVNEKRSSPVNDSKSGKKINQVDPDPVDPVDPEEEHRASVAMEMWLKKRLRTGVHRMKAEFDKRDPDGCGQVSAQDFLQVLATFGLKLKREQLKVFLSRCGLELQKGGVDYTGFLQTFQDRSPDGVMNRILSNPQHRFHSEENSSRASSVTAVEAKLARLFQTEYLSLLQAFRNLDKLHKGTVNKQEFRALMESRFGSEIFDGGFEQLVDRLPLDSVGDVQYGVFMAAFDSRKGAPSLFKAGTTVGGGGGGSSQEGPDEEEEGGSVVGNDQHVSKLSKKIRELVTQQYRDVVRTFEELDEKNTRRLTQEDLYQLLKRFPAHAEVTRGDVRRLWASLLTRQDGTLEFDQLVRQFGPSAESRRYPDAKRCPPKRGDADLMRLSNTLSYVSDIMRHNVRAKVELSARELGRVFSNIDVSRSGFVSPEEFRDVLKSLCGELTIYECELLANELDTNHNGRVSYKDFLRPFASREQAWRHGSNMAAALQSHGDNGTTASSVETLKSRIRKKLHRRRRALRRACLRLDPRGAGHLWVSELATVLQLCGVCDGQDELQCVFSLLETHSPGRLDYRPLLRKHLVTANERRPDEAEVTFTHQ